MSETIGRNLGNARLRELTPEQRADKDGLINYTTRMLILSSGRTDPAGFFKDIAVTVAETDYSLYEIGSIIGGSLPPDQAEQALGVFRVHLPFRRYLEAEEYINNALVRRGEKVIKLPPSPKAPDIGVALPPASAAVMEAAVEPKPPAEPATPAAVPTAVPKPAGVVESAPAVTLADTLASIQQTIQKRFREIERSISQPPPAEPAKPAEGPAKGVEAGRVEAEGILVDIPDLFELGIDSTKLNSSGSDFLRRETYEDLRAKVAQVTPRQMEDFLSKNPMSVLTIRHRSILRAFSPEVQGVVEKVRDKLNPNQVREYFSAHPLELLKIEPYLQLTIPPLTPQIRDVLYQLGNSLTEEQVRAALANDPTEVLTFVTTAYLGSRFNFLPQWLGDLLKLEVGRLTPDVVRDFLKHYPNKILRINYGFFIKEAESRVPRIDPAVGRAILEESEKIKVAGGNQLPFVEFLHERPHPLIVRRTFNKLFDMFIDLSDQDDGEYFRVLMNRSQANEFVDARNEFQEWLINSLDDPVNFEVLDPRFINRQTSTALQKTVFALVYERRDQVPAVWAEALQKLTEDWDSISKNDPNRISTEGLLKRSLAWWLTDKFTQAPQQHKILILERFADLLSRFTASEIERELPVIFQGRKSIALLDALVVHAKDAAFLNKTRGQGTLRTILQTVDLEKYRTELAQRLDQKEAEERATQQIIHAGDVRTIISYLQKVKDPESLGLPKPKDVWEKKWKTEHWQRFLERRLCRILNLPDEESVYQVNREIEKGAALAYIRFEWIFQNVREDREVINMEYLKRLFAPEPGLSRMIERWLEISKTLSQLAKDKAAHSLIYSSGRKVEVLAEWDNMIPAFYNQLRLAAEVDGLFRERLEIDRERDRIDKEYQAVIEITDVSQPEKLIELFRKRNKLAVDIKRKQNQVEEGILRYETDLGQRAQPPLRLVRRDGNIVLEA